ncbi:hypothetical protein [Aliiruegeria lutimaris]|nr:hypothetical protein [Aliiruegeria lutimaris]
MAKLGVLAQAGAGIMGAVGAVQQGNAAAKAAEASAKAADNAAINAIVEGEQRAELQMRKGAKLLGQQKAATAANGVDVSTGDALDLLDDKRVEPPTAALLTLPDIPQVACRVIGSLPDNACRSSFCSR